MTPPLLLFILALSAVSIWAMVLWRRLQARDATIDALKQTEEHFRLLGENIDEVFWLTSPDESRMHYVSPSYERITGRSPKPLHENPLTWLEVLHPRDRAQIERGVRDRGGKPDLEERDHEVRIVRPDGSIRWVWLRSRPITDSSGEIVARAGLGVDITGRKESERIMLALARGTSTAVGSDFFESLARNIAEVLKSRFVLVVEHMDSPVTRVRTRAFWAGDRLIDNVEYDLAGGPCEEAAAGEMVFHGEHIQKLFPADEGLVTLGAESYCGIPLRDSQGVVIGHLAVMDDKRMSYNVCEVPALPIFAARAAAEMQRLRAESALRESEERHRLLVDGVRLIAWEFDRLEQRFTWVSSQAEPILGYPVEDWYARDFWAEHLHPDDREQVTVYVRRQCQAGLDHEIEYRMLNKDGGVVWIRDLTTVVPPRGNPVRLRGVLIDISQRKMVELALRDSESHLRAVFDQAGVGMAVVDTRGHTIRCNPTLREMLGYDESELLKMTIADFTHPEDREATRRAIADVLEGRTDRIQLQKRYIRKDGSIVWGAVTLTVAYAGDAGTFAIGMIEDITERKRAQDELLRRNELERLLLSELNHRVRNNLSSLVTLVDLVRGRASDKDTFAAAIRDRILAMATVHTLLSGSRWAPTDLEQLLRSLLPDDDRERVKIDGAEVLVPTRQVSSLAMVLNELITNSVTHGVIGAGRGVVHVSWTAEVTDEEHERVELRWHEMDGSGIDTRPTPGLGTALIGGLVRVDLKGHADLCYPPTGADHRITVLLDRDDCGGMPQLMASSAGSVVRE